MGIAFWLIVLIVVIWWICRMIGSGNPPTPFNPVEAFVLLLIVLLGWAVFGAPWHVLAHAALIRPGLALVALATVAGGFVPPG